MIATIPMVKIADHRNSLSIRRPNCERDAFDPIDISQLRSHFMMHEVVTALAKEIDIVVRKCGQKIVGVRKLANLTVESLDL